LRLDSNVALAATSTTPLLYEEVAMPAVTLPIQEVTVYTDRALITRRGRVDLVTGPQDLVLSGIPACLVSDSVRAGGRGPTAVRLAGVDVRAAFQARAAEAGRRALDEECERLRDQDARLGERAAAIEGDLSFVHELRRAAAPDMACALARKRVELADCQGLLDFARDHIMEAHAELAGVNEQRRTLAAQLTAAERNLAALGAAESRRVHDVVVGVDAAAPGAWELEVSYVVDDARWVPVYDIHVRRDEGEGDGAGEPHVGLSLLALVSQRTGEEWADVALTLSTARPSLGTLPPKLTPWYIDLQQPYQRRDSGHAARTRMLPPPVPAAAGAIASSDDAFLAARAEADLPAAIVEASVEASGAVVSYTLPGHAGIPSDGAPHKVTVALADLPARLTYESVPRLLPHAFTRAEARNVSPLVLLPGEASVFHDGRFVGAVELTEVVAPEQEFTLYLGVDDGVTVERELTRRAVDKTLIGGNRRTSLSYRITVRNNHARAAHVTVRDQTPVSRHEQLKARVSRVEPGPAEQTDLGVLRWELNVPPGGMEQLNVDLVVEHPAGPTVTGLEGHGPA